MRETTFRFKKFSCKHGESSMKIGVDAVLLGAWADVMGKNILDVGTGCGVIALMCAQRNSEALIKGIDIDNKSIIEAKLNFKESPWSERLQASLEDFNYISLNHYDLIISNPPYFDSGILRPESRRLRARHEDNLSPGILIKRSACLLNDDGRLSMIIPIDREKEIIGLGRENNLFLKRYCHVKGNINSPVKRVLLEFSKSKVYEPVEKQFLILETSPGHPSEDYKELCKDFYIKF